MIGVALPNLFKKERVPAKEQRGFAQSAQQEKIILPRRSGRALRPYVVLVKTVL